MKIGIELRHVNIGSSGGVVQHLQNVLGTMFRLCPEDEFFVYCTIFNRSLFTHCPGNVRVFSLPAARFYPDLDYQLKEKGIDGLFRSFPALDSLFYPLKRQVFFIPDLQHEAFPEFFDAQTLHNRRMAFNRVMSRAGAIATNTQFTRSTILAHAENQCQDIFLITPSLTSQSQDKTATVFTPEEEALLPKGNYFYYPANLWPHKNHRRLLQAFQQFLAQAEGKVELILTGHPEGWGKLQSEFLGLPVRHLGFVRPQVVRHLYQHCTALVFFSLYEGFGMPLLEAFAAGAPVLCSNTTSLPEVGGNAVLVCDPLDIQAMSELMQRITQEQGLRDELIEGGKKRLPEFSWESSARNLRQAFQRLSQAPAVSTPANCPLVSIVTPSYNQGRFLKRTIESVLSQDYPHIEYMVMDGGSTDESVAILKSYGDRFAWVSEKDRGQTEAINKGFARSHGEILAYLNSDDVLLPGAVEKAVHFLLDHPEVDLVYGEADYIDKEDRVIGKYPTREYSYPYLTGECFICQPAAFWRKRIAEKVGAFDDTLNIVMDYDYWLRIANAGGTLVHLNENLACSRLYAETKTLSVREKVYAEIMKISKKNIGSIHHNYFLGLWNHRIWENGRGFYGVLRHIRGSLKTIALAHNLLANYRYYLRTVRPAWIKKQARHGLRSVLGIFRPVARKIRARHFRVDANRPVFGIWEDNWLGPVVQVFIKRKNPGSTLFLEGIPVDDMTVNVRVERQPVKQIALQAGILQQIEVEAEAGQRIILEFSKTKKDANGLYKTLLVTSTNLFAEHEITF